ncbi:MAG: chromate efflux transporter [Leptospirales bacterium]
MWVRIAALSFGGPAGQIAVVHRILVEEKRWIPEARFLHAMNYCMLLPGPEAQQLVTYMGWLLQGRSGGLIAGGLFIIPGLISILALSVLYVGYQDLSIVTALFFGLKPAVIAIIIQAVVRMGKRVLGNRTNLIIAASAFLAMFVFSIPFPYIVVCAAGVGFLRGAAAGKPEAPEFATAAAESPRVLYSEESTRPPTIGRSLRTALVWLSVWALPALLVLAILGQEHVLLTQAVFFSKTAIVTFGGAYSVLSYIAEQAVENFGWLSPLEMLDGLGLAETTPGPLIQVVQFVGFLGAFRNPAPFDPYTAAVLGSLMTVWVTFAPCFLWIFLGAPYMEALRKNESLRAMLAGVTAAVTGVILNLALWFAIHTLFGQSAILNYGIVHMDWPVFASVNSASVLLAGLAFALLFAARLSLFPTLAITTVTGMAWYLWVLNTAR